jgi:soluble lytic murein transglycosylase
MARRLVRSGGTDYRQVGGDINLLDPETSIHIGAYYLHYLEAYMGSPMLALLAYNGGMGRVRRWVKAAHGTAPDLFIETIQIAETRNYGKQVLVCAAVYGWLYYGLSMEKIAADIYGEV